MTGDGILFGLGGGGDGFVLLRWFNCCVDNGVLRRLIAIFVDRPPAASSLCPISDVGISMVPKISTCDQMFDFVDGSIFDPFNDGVPLAPRLAQ